MLEMPVLFDVGSERSFITEEAVQQLGIESARKEPLIVDGFGGMNTMRCTSARIKLKMRRTDGRFFTMFANSVPKLVSEIAVAKLTGKMLRQIGSTQSTSLPTVTVKPQILVGADYFHEIFRESASTKLPSGFHLLRTCLGDMVSGKGRSKWYRAPSKILPKASNRYCCNVAKTKDKILFVHPRSREIKTTSEEINCGAVRTKQDRRIVEKWTREIEKEESIFDAPPLPDISEERLQWVLGMIEKNHQAWEQSAEEKGKSMVDSVRDDAEEIIEAASEAIEKSSVTLAKELEDRLALAMDDRGSDRRRISNRVCRSDIPLPTVRPVLHKILPCTVPTQGKKIERSST
ncbi:unnamed protein product [Toxocara canis]|uniref:DUF1758 domain-containing protein n=1 Tax=Toxocara canis TaxID=6265 RepID=A0A183U5I0_TOXCA|nr:unnamed protein product [Toxocara canis]